MTFKRWLQRRKEAKRRGLEGKSSGSLCFKEEEIFVVPPFTFWGFIKEEVDWYFHKKKERDAFKNDIKEKKEIH